MRVIVLVKGTLTDLGRLGIRLGMESVSGAARVGARLDDCEQQKDGNSALARNTWTDTCRRDCSGGRLRFREERATNLLCVLRFFVFVCLCLSFSRATLGTNHYPSLVVCLGVSLRSLAPVMSPSLYLLTHSSAPFSLSYFSICLCVSLSLSLFRCTYLVFSVAFLVPLCIRLCVSPSRISHSLVLFSRRSLFLFLFFLSFLLCFSLQASQPRAPFPSSVSSSSRKYPYPVAVVTYLAHLGRSELLEKGTIVAQEERVHDQEENESKQQVERVC